MAHELTNFVLKILTKIVVILKGSGISIASCAIITHLWQNPFDAKFIKNRSYLYTLFFTRLRIATPIFVLLSISSFSYYRIYIQSYEMFSFGILLYINRVINCEIVMHKIYKRFNRIDDKSLFHWWAK